MYSEYFEDEFPCKEPLSPKSFLPHWWYLIFYSNSLQEKSSPEYLKRYINFSLSQHGTKIAEAKDERNIIRRSEWLFRNDEEPCNHDAWNLDNMMHDAEFWCRLHLWYNQDACDSFVCLAYQTRNLTSRDIQVVNNIHLMF